MPRAALATMRAMCAVGQSSPTSFAQSASTGSVLGTPATSANPLAARTRRTLLAGTTGAGASSGAGGGGVGGGGGSGSPRAPGKQF